MGSTVFSTEGHVHTTHNTNLDAYIVHDESELFAIVFSVKSKPSSKRCDTMCIFLSSSAATHTLSCLCNVSTVWVSHEKDATSHLGIVTFGVLVSNKILDHIRSNECDTTKKQKVIKVCKGWTPWAFAVCTWQISTCFAVRYKASNRHHSLERFDAWFSRRGRWFREGFQ